MVVIGWESEMTAMSFAAKGAFTPGKFGFRTKLVMGTPGLETLLNDMDGIPNIGRKQCAAVRIVRELISEPVQPDVLKTGLNRLTTLGNWLPAS
jgi:hypothetical protein